MKRVEHDGKLSFTLAGLALAPHARIEVMADGRWISGTFECTGYGLRPVAPHVETASGKYMFLEPDTVCRWPEDRP